MKLSILATAALLLVAGTSMLQAQPAPPAAIGRDAGPAPDAPPPPPHGGPGGRGPGFDRPMPPAPSPAAHFRIERGANVVDVKCEDGQPTKACAEIVQQFVDRMPIEARR